LQQNTAGNKNIRNLKKMLLLHRNSNPEYDRTV